MKFGFHCSNCDADHLYDKNTVFCTLLNTGYQIEFCSEKCLDERLSDLYNGVDITPLAYLVADRFDFKKEVISYNPLTVEITLFY